MFTWLLTFAGAKTVGFIKDHLLQIIIAGLIIGAALFIWGAWVHVNNKLEETTKELAVKEQALKTAEDANRTQQAVIDDLQKGNELRDQVTAGLRKNLAEQSKTIETMRDQLRKVESHPLTPALKATLTDLQRLEQQADDELQKLHPEKFDRPAGFTPTPPAKPAIPPKATAKPVKGKLTNLTPQRKQP